MKTWKILLDEVAKYEASPKEENSVADCSTYLSMSDVILMINEGDEDGNTMLHLAANGHSLEILWQLLEIGIDPCKKNKKLQTAYVITSNKEVRNTFRRFMAINPNKFDYNKVKIFLKFIHSCNLYTLKSLFYYLSRKYQPLLLQKWRKKNWRKKGTSVK